MQDLIQELIILETYPNNQEVIKKIRGEKITVFVKFNPSIVNSDKKLIVEAWTNINSQKMHSYKLKQGNDNTFFATILLKNTGLFQISFRYRFENQKHWNWQGKNQHNDYAQIHVDPEYIQNSIVYNAFIRFFGHNKLSKDGKIKLGDSGTFDDLKKRLKEIKNMGANILYLNPIHMIGELYRNYNPHDQFPSYLQPGCPYSIKDYKSVDPELGVDIDNSFGPHKSLSDPMKEFKALIKEAHKLKIKVYMDLVFNHTSHDFVLQRLHPEWFLYKENIQNLDEPYLYPSDIKLGKPWGDAKHTFCPRDHGFWWEDAAQLNWEYLLPKASNEPPKNPTIKDMYEYFKSIPKYWIKHVGIDGFRCDVAYRVPTKFWKECIHEAREFAKKEKTNLSNDVVFVAETYCDDLKELLSAGFSSVYGDFGNKLYSPLTLKGYLDYMYNLSGNFFPENSKFFIFPECHDFNRMTSRVSGEENPRKDLSEKTNKSRWVLTATLPGIPMIFNGFEKLEWQKVNLFSYSDIDWESDKDLKEHITKVNTIRNSHKALQNGNYTFLNTNQNLNEHTQVMAYSRISGNEKIIVVVNMDIWNDAYADIYLSDELVKNDARYILKDLLTDTDYIRSNKTLPVVLKPGESHIFLMKRYTKQKLNKKDSTKKTKSKKQKTNLKKISKTKKPKNQKKISSF